MKIPFSDTGQQQMQDCDPWKTNEVKSIIIQAFWLNTLSPTTQEKTLVKHNGLDELKGWMWIKEGWGSQKLRQKKVSLAETQFQKFLYRVSWILKGILCYEYICKTQRGQAKNYQKACKLINSRSSQREHCKMFQLGKLEWRHIIDHRGIHYRSMKDYALMVRLN